jgi:hypothetical protein
MPYLTKKRKDELKDKKRLYTTAGDLTYGLTILMIAAGKDYEIHLKDAFLSEVERFTAKRPESFAMYAVVLGSLTAAEEEFIRRVQPSEASDDILGCLSLFRIDYYREYVAPYEDKKIEENGDVF